MDASPQMTGALPRPRTESLSRYNRLGLIALAALILITIIGNIALWSMIQANNQPLLETRPEVSDGYVLVSFTRPDHAYVATLSNQVLSLEQGTNTAEFQASGLIGGLLATDDTVYIGTADGKITTLDLDLTTAQELAAVTGRVVGMKPLDNLYLVAHGVGPYSDQYWVTQFEYGGAEPGLSTRVEFTISSIDAKDSTAFYGTANARVGAIDLVSGEILWSATVGRPVTRVLAVDGGGVLVGDERGNLYLLDAAGETLWQTELTGFKIRSLAYESVSDNYFVGDTEGNVYAINSAGEQLLVFEAAQDDIEDLYALETDQKIIVPRSGGWQTLNPTAISSTGVMQQYQTAQLLFNLASLLAIIMAVVYTVENWRVKASKTLFRMWRGRVGYMLLLPSMALIIMFGYYPALMAIYYSFTDFRAGEVVQFIGLDNYIRILTQDRFFSVGFGNMILIVITNIIKVITMPLLIAELIFWLKRERRRYIFRTLYLLPAVVPGLVAVYMWTMVYDPYDGLLNQVLALFGLPSDMAWLANEQTAIWAIIFAGFPFISAFPLLIYMGGLLNINPEMFEAARIDGANWWTRFWRIDFPMLRPQTMLLIFFAFNGAVSGFEHIFVFTRGGPGIATYVPGLQMYFRIAEGQFGYASAIGAILFVIVFIGTLVLVGNRRFSIALDSN